MNPEDLGVDEIIEYQRIRRKRIKGRNLAKVAGKRKSI